MYNKEFDSRIASVKVVKIDSQVKTEIKLIYVDENPIQLFLESWDVEYNKNMNHPFKSNNIYWDAITYNENFNNLSLLFDSNNIKCDIKKIIVKKIMEKFIYEIVITKNTDKDDEMISNIYYKCKEYDENDKLKFVFFNTCFKKLF